MRSGRGGQPSQPTPTATPSSASRTASLVRNMGVGRPDSAAPTATRKATVTFSVSSSPVLRLMTAFPAIAAPLSIWRRGPGGAAGASRRDATSTARLGRPGFPLQIERHEGVEQTVLHGEQGGGRARGRADLGVDALDMRLGGLRGDPQLAGNLTGRGASGDQDEHLDP